MLAKEDPNFLFLNFILLTPRFSESQGFERQRDLLVDSIVVTETLPNNKRVIYAAQFNGFAGYYEVDRGGVLGGRKYNANKFTIEEALQQQLNHTNTLDIALQGEEVTNAAINWIKNGNKYVDFAKKVCSWNHISGNVEFFFQTKDGIYLREVGSNNIEGSIWQKVLAEARHMRELLENS